MLERIKELSDLIVMNDEAHHVHDPDLEWSRSLTTLHDALPGGLSLWLDFSATPKDQNGTYFPWVITDYPLAQAVEDRIVKAPLIVHRVERGDPERVNRDNVVEAYGDWLLAALSRWREHHDTYAQFGLNPVLFVMAERSTYADEIGNWLTSTQEIGLSEDEVLVIHTKGDGEITKADLDKAREAVRDIDRPESKIKVVVSVLMLREGWDVRSVTVVLGLRPFTASAKILPEQAVGRGLRLMSGISPDRTQTLEVMGTEAFEAFVRELETKGVGIRTTTKPPPPPVKIEPVLDKMEHDISIPITAPVYERSYTKLSDLDAASLTPLYEMEVIGKLSKITLRMEFAPTETDVHEVDIEVDSSPPAHELVSSITRKVENEARLRSGWFARLYPFVLTYTATRCFGGEIDLEDEGVRSHLRSPRVQGQIAEYLAGEIGRATVETKPLQFEERQLKLSDTKTFTWRRNLPLVECERTVFNLVATYNDYEKQFALFLDGCPDVARFAALGTTEQESGASFRVNYLKPSGAIGFYYPDFVVVQRFEGNETNWIVETKGRVWEDTEAKDTAIRHWCEEVSTATGIPWRYVRVNQTTFEALRPDTFGQLIDDSGGDSTAAEEPSGGLLDEEPTNPQGTTTEPSPDHPPRSDAPTPSETVQVLHDCIPEGVHVEHGALLRTAASRLGHPDLPNSVRRLLNKAISAEDRAGRLRTDWQEVWRPKKRGRRGR